MTMAIGVPSAIKTFNWLGTLWGGKIRLSSPMLFAIGFVSLFVSGGISGPFLAQPVLDIPLHDTYFVTGHFHLIMGVASIFGIFAATYYWFPKMFGRLMNESLARWHFWFSFVALTPSSCPCIISEWRDIRGVTLNSLKSAFFTTCSRCRNSSPTLRSSPSPVSSFSCLIFSGA